MPKSGCERHEGTRTIGLGIRRAGGDKENGARPDRGTLRRFAVHEEAVWKGA